MRVGQVLWADLSTRTGVVEDAKTGDQYVFSVTECQNNILLTDGCVVQFEVKDNKVVHVRKYNSRLRLSSTTELMEQLDFFSEQSVLSIEE